MNTSSLVPSFGIGDLLFRPKAFGLVEHCGVGLGGGYVLENAPEAGERVVPVARFAQGQPVRVQSTGQHPSQVLTRAQRVLARPRRWHATDRNCEHTAHEVAYGRAFSPQLAGIVLALAVVAGLVIIARRR